MCFHCFFPFGETYHILVLKLKVKVNQMKLCYSPACTGRDWGVLGSWIVTTNCECLYHDIGVGVGIITTLVGRKETFVLFFLNKSQALSTVLMAEL